MGEHTMAILAFQHVMKQFNQQTILKNLNFTIEPSSTTGFRMTQKEAIALFDLLEKKEVPSSGNIEFTENFILSERKSDHLYLDLSVKGYLQAFGRIGRFSKELDPFIDAFSLRDIWSTKIHKLTFDQKKRVALLRSMMLQADLVLLESPLTDLSDEGTELYIKALSFLKTQDVALLFTSPYLEELFLLTDNVYHYSKQDGLEKIDIQNEEAQDPDNETPELGTPLQPTTLFKIACKLEDKTIFFSPNEIDFIESVNSISTLRIGSEQFPTTLTMNELENKLTTFGFFRCHRSYLVNLQRITELVSYSRNSYTLILKGEERNKIPLSRSRLDELKQLLEGA